LNEILIDDIKNLVNKLPDEKLLKIQENLYKKNIKKKFDSYQIKKILKLNSDETKILLKILKNTTSVETIIIAIDLIQEINKKQSEIRKNTSLIWTSPSIFHENAGNTKSTILRLISSAKKSITIVGYVMDYGVKDVLTSLVTVAEKHPLKIKIILDRADKPPERKKKMRSPQQIIERAWPSTLRKPEIYKYAKRSDETVLHAKMLVIDSQKVLVTSANLTGRAIHGNLEIGILHKGHVAKKAENLIHDLIANRTLVQTNG
tara:strand:+ start:6035 stop:6817 length:783 start_codon:yes stop_codon:yes gene_type:complete